MSAIADRIAGRDLDRDTIADKMDEALETLALLSVPDRILRPEESDIEFLTVSLEPDTCAEARNFDDARSAFSYAVPMVGHANMGTVVDWGNGGQGIAVFHMRPATRDEIHADLGVSRGSVPPRVFSIRYREGSGFFGAESPAMYYALAGTELWSLTRGEGGPHRRDAGRGFAWTASVAATRDGALEGWPASRIGRTAQPATLALCGVRSMMLRRFNWGMTIGHPGFVGSYVECSPEGARALFADRNVVGGKRRTALRHWVKEHYRRGHTPEEAHKVREHLRGVERFTWHGLDIKLQVPSAETEAAGLAARGAK